MDPTRPPVVLDHWRAIKPGGGSWTTVMTWNNFKESIEHQGRTYGAKEREFDRVMSLPSFVDARFELAVGGKNPPVDTWRRHGWSVVPAASVSGTHSDYRRYIEGSRGEFSVAENVYVATNSGWFSCRSVCYLASGLPVVVQDTGFTDHIPVGSGLHAFSSLKEAVIAIEQVESNYEDEASSARELAKQCFAAPMVLGEMLDRMGL